MKRTLSVLAISMIVLLSLAAKAQSGATTGTITDNSLVFKGYYQGSTQPSGGGQGSDDKSITLTFYNKDGVAINHNHQTEWGGSEGTVVEAKGSSYQDSNTDTIFRWTMEGKTASEVTLRFTFSTMQAQVNGKYFRPTYTITMLQNPTSVTAKITTVSTTQTSSNGTSNWRDGRSNTNTSNSTSDYDRDPFYSSTNRAIGATKSAEPSASEYLETSNVEYVGSLSAAQETETTYSDVTYKNRTYTRTKYERTMTISSWTRSNILGSIIAS